MNSWLQDNNIEMYSINNKGKSFLTERCIRNLKNKIYKYMTATSKNVHFDKLDNIVNKYNNMSNRIIKMKPVDVKPSIYIDFNKENNKESPKFKFGDQVKISKFKNIFAKVYVANWSEEIFVNKKVKNTVPWTYLISDLNRVEIVGNFYGKELQKNKSKRI